VASCERRTEQRGEFLVATEWVGLAEAAAILEVPLRTMQRSLSEDDRRASEWGDEGEGWRLKPLSKRRIYQLRRSKVLQKAGKPTH
jgi:hypothetical protein